MQFQPSVPADLPQAIRKAPVPTGFFGGRRGPHRRRAGRGWAAFNQAFLRTPIGRFLHARMHARIDLCELRVPLTRGGQGLAGLRIAWLSDLHAGHYMGEADLCRLFERVAATEPHLVCLGGDLINTREDEILLLERALACLQPPLGIHAVPGNHDYYGGIEHWSDFLRAQGVQVHVNRGVRISHGDASLWLAGVDDLVEGEPDLARALDGRRDDEPVLLLAHNPDFFYETAGQNIDLTLSGHTHAGQIRLFRWPLMVHAAMGYIEGLYEEAGSRLYVGRGVGVTVFPLRIGTRGEVTLLELGR